MNAEMETVGALDLSFELSIEGDFVGGYRGEPRPVIDPFKVGELTAPLEEVDAVEEWQISPPIRVLHFEQAHGSSVTLIRRSLDENRMSAIKGSTDEGTKGLPGTHLSGEAADIDRFRRLFDDF